MTYKNPKDMPICDIPHPHLQDIAELNQELPSEDAFIEAAMIFGQLCDSTRLRILYLLCHNSVCVCNIADAIGMSAPAVSHHLRSLKMLGLLEFKRVGKEVYYTLADNEDGRLIHKMIDDMFGRSCMTDDK